jgi:hypothetical protein
VDGLPAYDDLPPLLPTDRELRLRPWEPADVPAVLAACLQPSTQRWIDAFRGYDEGSARRYVLGAPDAWARRRHRDDLSVQHCRPTWAGGSRRRPAGGGPGCAAAGCWWRWGSATSGSPG